MEKISAIIANYKEVPGGLIEAFHAIQKEYSYIPEEALKEAAKAFNLPLSKVYGVATFYSYLSVKNRGKNIIRVCASAPCHIKGAAEVVAAVEKELGIKLGETTADGKFALEATECVGACQMTPVITINGKPFGDLTPEKVPAVLAQFK
ncbi:MAG: NADH-quinone oxidoreductase subunit NuoE [Firmicutes bacterium]|nr:NADH-quinone oxidoreductase subunit NuoE [Bacillota bacterium]